MVAEVFIFWAKSHVRRLWTHTHRESGGGAAGYQQLSHCVSVFFRQNFKREEQNFVVQNEINNMSFLITDTKCKMSKVYAEKNCFL